MKLLPTLLILAATPLMAQSRFSPTQVQATTTLHDDNTRTESVRDTNKRELTETIYNSRGVVIGGKWWFPA